MAEERKEHILKIFSGPHVGAEFELTSGSYDIGSDEMCDIVLSDSMVAAHHVRLVIEDEAMHLKVLEQQPAFIDGGLVPGESEHPLQAYQVVTIGTTHFWVGLVGESWPDVVLPEIERLQTQQKKTSDGEHQQQDGEDVTSDGAAEELEHATSEGGYEEQEGAAPAAHPVADMEKPLTGSRSKSRGMMTEKSSEKTKKRRSRRTLLIVVAIAIFLGVLIYECSTRHKQEIVITPNSRVEKINVLLEQLHIEHVTASVEGEEGITVQGYVDTIAKEKKLKAALKDFHPPVTQQIYTTQRLIQACRQVLSGLGITAKVTSDGQGGITLQGFVPSQEKMNSALELLKQDVKGVQFFSNSMLVTPVFLSYANSVLNEFGLQRNMRLIIQGAAVVATGQISLQQEEDWKAAKQKIVERFGGGLVLQDNTLVSGQPSTNISPGIDILDLPVAGISLGDVPFLLTKDGRVLFEGSELKDRYVIKSIGPAGVIISHDGQEQAFSVGNQTDPNTREVGRDNAARGVGERKKK